MDVLKKLSGGLVVSCQPVDDGPMDTPEIVAALAAAAVAGGAVGVRIEGVENLAAARTRVDVPIIGIVKEDLADSPVRITPRCEQVQALDDAGADIIAYDATSRPRVDTREEILAEILATGKLAMADCATLQDGIAAQQGGATILGSTLSGYTEETVGSDGSPDLSLVRAFHSLGAFVMAEGRYTTPDLVAAALAAGADSVTVGSALTRLELMTASFVDAIKRGRF